MNVSSHDVHQALVKLGRLRFGEMRVEDAFREVVQTTHAMFDVDGAGLMLTDADQHLRYVAASDDRFAHLEELQVDHGEGPCIDAFDHKELVRAEDLESDPRWPRFCAAAGARRGPRRAGQPVALQPGRRGRGRGAVGAAPSLVARGGAGTACLHRPRRTAYRHHDGG